MTKLHQLDNYEVDPVYGCWLFLGAKGNAGYGVIWRGKTSTSFHVAMYEKHVGPVPSGMVVDHLCRRRPCGAPHHVQAVTRRENELRKNWGYRCRIAKCPRGHSMEGAIVTPEMGRVCRECERIAKEKQ